MNRQLSVTPGIGPDPALPDWRDGEIDANGNRFWMVNYHGRFIKYVEYQPEWTHSLSLEELWGPIAKIHPRCLQPDGCLIGDVLGGFIYPENPPTPALNQPQPNQLYGRQLTTSQITPAPKAQLHR